MIFPKKINSSDGFTLVELIITMLLAGIISISIFSAYKAQQRSYIVQDQVTEMQQRIRAGLQIMVKELRMAGYNPNLVAGLAGVTIADPEELQFTLVADDDGVDNDGVFGIDQPNELRTVTFDIYDAAYTSGPNDLGRQVDGGKRAIIENIEELEFYYTLEDGTQTTDPTAVQHENIRSVQVSILVRADLPDEEFSIGGHIFTTPSGASWGPYNVTPGDDKIRRRLLTTTVQFRNLGLDLI